MHWPTIVNILEFLLLIYFFDMLFFSPCFNLLWSYQLHNSVSCFLNLVIII